MPTTEQLRTKLINKLKELFQLNQPDLDFGFYRIMHAKSEQVSSFIENDLLQVIQDTFGQVDETKKDKLKQELDEAIQTAKAYGAADPESTDKVMEARAKYDAIKDSASSEAEIYDHLYRFFERYYDDGDFISRRYYTRETPGKAAPFAVPYNGEEVKLHWANADQYYIKTTEYFTNFTVNLSEALRKLNDNKKQSIEEIDFVYTNVPEDLKVHFRIIDATEGEHANVKANDATKRYFLIHKDKPVELNEKNELIINFEYRPTTDKTKQDDLNKEAVALIVKSLKDFQPQNTQKSTEDELKERFPCNSVFSVVSNYLSALTTQIPTEKDKDRILLTKYINQYTARNTTDYFIHKNLGAFLKRELDFYIKNEIMRLDDIENAEVPKVEDYLAKIKVLRKIAIKLIEFMAQLEDFQKKLWLKKKFVVETNYCITLDRIPKELYPQIIENKDQINEWIKLYAIDEIEGDTTCPAFTNPPTLNFLKVNDKLLVDTRFFDDSFKARLISSIQNFDDQCDGLLIHSENYQALNLLQERYREQVKCVYIDPPYNTDGDSFMYKDSYKHSTWISCIDNRLQLSRELLSTIGTIGVSIDDNESHNLEQILASTFGENKLGELAVVRAEGGGLAKNLVIGHDLLKLFARNIVNCPPLLRPKDIRGKIVDINGRRFWIETDWLRTEFGKYGTLRYEDIETVKGLEKKKEIDEGIDNGLYILIKDGDKHIVGRFRALDEDGSKFYSVVKHLNSEGVKSLVDLKLSEEFKYPKPVSLIKQYVLGSTFGKYKNEHVLDYFAGSGTTGHAILSLNRDDGGKRKYILVEMGDYFDTVLKPRIQKVVYSKDWNDGKPVSKAEPRKSRKDTKDYLQAEISCDFVPLVVDKFGGISHCFKYLRLESYEDTLNNLVLQNDPIRDKALASSASLQEDYLLHYMLDVESRCSQSLLNIDAFNDPTSYVLKVKRPGSDEYIEKAVDLIETFNYLIGLRLVHLGIPQSLTAAFTRMKDPDLPQDQDTKLVINGDLKQVSDGKWWIRKVEGWVPKNPYSPNDGLREKVLIVWRKLTGNLEEDNLILDAWFTKNRISTLDWEFDTIYVNGSNNLPNLQKEGDTWKVRLIEEEFMKRMWDTAGV